MARIVNRRDLLRVILLTGSAAFMAACKLPVTQLEKTSTQHPIETLSRQPTETLTPRPTETLTVTLTATPSPTQTPDMIKVVQASIEPVINQSGGETRIAQGELLTLQIKSEPPDRVPAVNDKRPPAKLPESGSFNAIRYNRDGSANITVIDGYKKDAQAESVKVNMKDLSLVWDASRGSLVLDDANGEAKFEFIQYEDVDYNVQGAWFDATPHAGIPEILRAANWFNWESFKSEGFSYAEAWINKMDVSARQNLTDRVAKGGVISPIEAQGESRSLVVSPFHQQDISLPNLPLALARAKISGRDAYILSSPFLSQKLQSDNQAENLKNTDI